MRTAHEVNSNLVFIQRKEIDDVSDTSSQSETDEVSEITVASQPVGANLKIESSV